MKAFSKVVLILGWILWKSVYSLRIIVLAFDRPRTLWRCLESLQSAHHSDNDGQISLRIQIDCKGKVNKHVVRAAIHYPWKLGEKQIFIHRKHQGIMGQWLAIPPIDNDNDDYILIMEDDIIISPYYLKIVQAIKNKSLAADVWAMTFQRAQWQMGINEHGKWRRLDMVSDSHPLAYLMESPATWALLVLPGQWKRFLSYVKGFNPLEMNLTQGAITTKWAQERGVQSIISPLIYEYLRTFERKILFFHLPGKKVLASEKAPLDHSKAEIYSKAGNVVNFRRGSYATDEILQDDELVTQLVNFISQQSDFPRYTGCLDLIQEHYDGRSSNGHIMEIKVNGMTDNITKFLMDFCRIREFHLVSFNGTVGDFDCNQKVASLQDIERKATIYRKTSIIRCPYTPGLYPHEAL